MNTASFQPAHPGMARFRRTAARVAILAPFVLACVLTTAAQAQFTKSPSISKFTQELRGAGPGGIPVAVPDGTRNWPGGVAANHYTIDIEQFSDQLHPDLPGPTTLWGYNPETALGVNGTPVPRHLGGIIIATKGTPTQITFRNMLPNAHILPVDTTIMGAMDAQNRTSTHLHGGFVPWISDGGPFAWWDPQGNKGVSFLSNEVLRPGEAVPDDEAEVYYPNQETARMEWYHDHALGTTRLNAYAGIATAYIIRDNFERFLVNWAGLPKFIEDGGRELPIVIQDKIFMPQDDPTFPGSAKTAGSLWYPYVYDPLRWELQSGMPSPPAVSCVPEMFGDTMLVNGTPYPKATVDPRRYRLRILNACQARFLNLQLYEDDGTGQPDVQKPGPDFLVIGTEGGFLARAVSVPSKGMNITLNDPGNPGNPTVDPADPGGSLLTAPAERWDVVVNFHGKGGKKYILCNDAPAPFPMGDAVNDYPNADNPNGNTQVLMRFEVKQDDSSIAKDRWSFIGPGTPLAGAFFTGIDRPLAVPDPKAPDWWFNWLTARAVPLPIPTRAGITVRQVTLNETFDEFGRLIQMEGNNVATGPEDFSRHYDTSATETPTVGDTEVWQIVNLTGDTHPIHFHLVNAQLLSRQPFDVEEYLETPVGQTAAPTFTGPARGPLPTELGWKETFKSNPGEVTTVIMKFKLPQVPFAVPESPRTGGYEYVWHCHILDHEEHDMMRPLVVMPPA